MVGIISSSWPTSSAPIAHMVPERHRSLSDKDIYHIAFLLRQVLVPDLIPQILECAKIFSISTLRKTQDLTVPREQSPQICLLTPPIYTRVRRENPVAMVSFRITARDDGLALGIGRSYFTAAVLRGCHLERGGLSGYLNTLDGVALGSQKIICVNTIASDVYETHRVELKRDAYEREEAAWVADLRAGDRIIVNAHAQWASFSNQVAEVEIQVHTMAVVR